MTNKNGNSQSIESEQMPLSIEEAANYLNTSVGEFRKSLIQEFGNIAATWKKIQPKYMPTIERWKLEGLPHLPKVDSEQVTGSLPEAVEPPIYESSQEPEETPPKAPKRSSRKKGGELTKAKSEQLDRSKDKAGTVNNGTTEVLRQLAVQEGIAEASDTFALKVMASEATTTELNRRYLAGKVHDTAEKINKYQEGFDASSYLTAAGLPDVGNSLSSAQKVTAKGLEEINAMTKQILKTALPIQQEYEVEEEEETEQNIQDEMEEMEETEPTQEEMTNQVEPQEESQLETVQLV
jgi:hypothetical protein